jgi:hypothetical protein
MKKIVRRAAILTVLIMGSNTFAVTRSEIPVSLGFDEFIEITASPAPMVFDVAHWNGTKSIRITHPSSLCIQSNVASGMVSLAFSSPQSVAGYFALQNQSAPRQLIKYYVEYTSGVSGASINLRAGSNVPIRVAPLGAVGCATLDSISLVTENSSGTAPAGSGDYTDTLTLIVSSI